MNNPENRHIDPAEESAGERPENREELDRMILDRINAALKELGSKMQWQRAPESRPEYEPLSGKRVVMLDDVKGVLENMIPELIAATHGNAVPVHFTGQEMSELVARIQKENPDIVLLDYKLSNKVKGTEVASSLRASGYDKLILGFSSETGLMLDFAAAGADGSVVKEPGFIEESVAAVAKCVSDVEKTSALLKKRQGS